MGDTEWVQVVNRCCQLMCYAPSQVLIDDEFTFVEERKEVTAIKDLHHDVYGILILENVKELDYVWMLADLEHLYLPL